MAKPTAKEQDEGHYLVEGSPRATEDNESVKDEPEEISSAKADFKARIGEYAYSPVKPAKAASQTISPHASDPVTPNPRKHRAESTSTSTSVRSKRRATAICASLSPSTSKSAPTKSAKRSIARKALRSTDSHSPVNNLVDSIRPGLMLLMIGLNPGLKTAETGHAYAHPSNLFWKLMHSSGLTNRRHLPSETHDLMDLYSIGNTNLCLRPTRDGAGLRKEELEAGVPILEEKARAFRPEVVCIVGKGIWETILKVKVKNGVRKQAKNEFKFGWQDESLWLGREVDDDGEVLWAGARTFVATSTSGLAASTKPAEKAIIWKELGDWIVAKRAEDMVKAEEDTRFEVKDEVADNASRSSAQTTLGI
jgi:mismatch-specific thymine-DNA glycosylase